MAKKDYIHLNVVIDHELRKRLEAYARDLDPSRKRPNLSLAVRNILRAYLGLPTVTEEVVRWPDSDRH